MSERVVLITGAAGNLGAAVAQAFAGRGARLALADRNTERLAVQAAELGAFTYGANATDAEQIAGLVAAVQGRYGRLDVLVNLVGTYRGGKPIHETDPDEWDFLMNVNARSVWLMCRAVVPVMLAQGGGKIVSVAARAGLQAGRGAAAYAASKAAVIRITESVSLDVRDHGINVNCVLPSTIDTPQNREMLPKADPSKWVAPEQVADAIVFLASEEAGGIHGAAIPVYGRA
jgi:NAD(P)-dependent dehydrogenase (short-subunit alcohol dehydrogenase family)